MPRRSVQCCPACGGHMHVRRLECDACSTVVEGRFARSPFDHLTSEQYEFIEVFLFARGNIKEVERVLGISYPTVRNRLDSILASLSQERKKKPLANQRHQILRALNEGELSVEEAITLLRGETNDR